MKQQRLIDIRVEPSPHEAQTLANLVMPIQLEEIRDLCRQLKTKPVIEIFALFGDVSLYKLHTASAQTLIDKLRTCLEAQQ